MEEYIPKKKRGAEAAGGGGGGLPTSKKQAIEVNKNEEFKLDPKVLQYQNKQMYIRIQEQKSEINDLNNKLSSLASQQERSDASLALVGRVWNQFNESLHLLLGRLTHQTDGMDIDKASVKYSSFLQFLLKCSKEDQEAQLALEDALQLKTHNTHSILQRVVEAVEKERLRTDNLTAALKDDSTMKALAEENERLRKAQSTAYDDLQSRFKELSRNYDELREKNVKIEKKLKKTSEELLDTQDKLAVANRKLIKQTEQFKEELQALKYQQVKSEPSEHNDGHSNSNNNNISNNNTNNNSNSRSPTHAKSESTDTSAFEEQIADLTQLAQARLDTIKRYQEERLELVKNLERAEREARYPLEEVIIRSRPYQMIHQQFAMVSSELEHSRVLCDKLNRDLASWTSTHRTEREKFQNTELAKRELLEKQLRDAELTANRLRSERDSLNSRLEAKNVAPSIETLKEMRTLLESKDNEIKRHKEQCERQKQELQKFNQLKEDHRKSQEKLHEQLDQKTAELKDMHFRMMDYSKQLDDFKNKRRDPNSNTGSDRAKELEKYEQELSELRKDASAKQAKADRTIAELKSELENAKAEGDAYLSEIEAIEKHFSELQTQQKRYVQQLSEKEETITKLMSEQIRLNQLSVALKEERQLLVEKATKADERTAKQEELLSKSEQRLKLLQDQLKKQADEAKATTALIEQYKRSAREHQQACTELRVHLERLEKENADNKARAEERAQSAERANFKAERLDEDINNLRRKLDRLSGRGGSDTLLTEERNILKQKLTCSVCNDREKSCIIARCYHQFCRPCVQRNLEVRSRKCPACGKSFAESDVHEIYF